MDFDFGTIFYVIITLVLVIIGAAKKNKKKPIAQAPPAEGEDLNENPPPNNDLSTNLKKIFGEFLDDMGDEITTKTPVQEDYFEDRTEYMQEPVLDSRISKVDVVEKEEGTPTVSEREMFDLQSHLQVKSARKSALVRKLMKNFNGKEAILYSEIINPKYF